MLKFLPEKCPFDAIFKVTGILGIVWEDDSFIQFTPDTTNPEVKPVFIIAVMTLLSPDPSTQAYGTFVTDGIEWSPFRNDGGKLYASKKTANVSIQVKTIIKSQKMAISASYRPSIHELPEIHKAISDFVNEK